MRSLLAALTGLPFVAGFALAAQPAPLNDVQMDAVIAGIANLPTLYGPGINLGVGSDALSNAQAASQPAPMPVYTSSDPPDQAALAKIVAAAQAAAPPPPPTPTQQFSSLLSSNSIGLR